MLIDLTPFYAADQGLPFVDRRAVMPWRPQQPVAPQDIAAHWQRLCLQPLPANKRLIYVHIPFCATHCKFCGFYQNKVEEDAIAQYCDYVLREIEQEASSPLHQSAPVHAVYFGGGTPTALSAHQLYQIISTLRRLLPLSPDCEITVEGRILNFDDERIDACLDAGANRFSIGIQTFDTRLRQRMGRRANREEAITFLRRLGERDRAAVVCDLMFGLPEQTPASWREDLEIVRDLPLDGVDLYALNLLPSTPLGKAVENHRVTLPDVSLRRDFYLQGEAFLAQDGWHQISNSHWARTTRERNLYNLLIKQGADCLAFGSGAGGNLGGQSYMTARRLEDYYQHLDAGQKPIMMMTAGTSDEQRWRLDLQGGIEAGRYNLSRIIDDPRPLQPLLQQWQQCGLMHSAGAQFTLTPAGRFWASNMLQALQTLIPQLTLRTDLYAHG